MSKQIYIDSNGNEVQVSGTVNTADMLPIEAGSSKMTSEAIGDLTTLTTSVTSSLVGAINEIASYTPVYGNTASGAIATFDTSLALPLQDCTIAINAVQESGTPTPSSPKAISGFTGANIHVADNETPHIIDNVTAITWQSEAGTVYGGSLDVTSGVLTITHAVVDLGSLSWNMYTVSQGNLFRSNSISDALKFNNVDIICEIYPTVKSSLRTDMSVSVGSTNTKVDIIDNNYSDAASFKTGVTGYKLVYPLAIPTTVQLTPTQVSAIVGTNNIFTDTNGNTSVVYACSLKDYIEGQ